MWSWSCVPFGFNKIMRLFSIAIQIGWVDVLDVEADVWSWAVQYIQKIMAIMAVKSNEDCFHSTYHKFILRALQLHHASNSSLRVNLRATVLLFVICHFSFEHISTVSICFKALFCERLIIFNRKQSVNFQGQSDSLILSLTCERKKNTYRLWIC